ncbi:MAG TPA: ribonuclease H-like domain-containing protein [Candidatus Aminicenantes bacterium]|nr:ribonuclease H-like domain-containing protein [Candidatus Aminicenantes bacterium]HRY65307.1 ribonuclease H-like domain-containing protein [Candidatus Aminicenantes bacterium]HRZ72225.1 ribonuclease H-like domain-containing protein [Candidatus Aminicenantes bacterium]
MPLEDKLNQLRREREAKARARTVESTWEKIGQDDADLTVKQKLERLIALTDKGRGQAARPGERPAPAKRREAVQVFENSFALGACYGQIPISMGLQIPADIVGFLSRDAAFEGLDLSTAVFLDLETTGLAGGTGTIPFLIGLAYYRDERFKVTQFFLNEMAEEDRLVGQLDRFVREMGFKSVVTYNGKVFDVPLVETRFAMHRTPCPLRGLPHLDFLFSARSLWKHKYDSCKLFTLAQEIVQAERSEDIPGAEIPLRYFQYIRSGDFSLIDPILYHNQEDLLSLLGLIVAGALLVERHRETASSGGGDPMDLYGVASLFERSGDAAKSAALLEKALAGGRGLTAEASQAARKKLSRHFKKNKDWDKALPFWQEMAAGEGVDCDCFRELAMYFEHTARDYGEAIRVATEGLALAKGRSPLAEKDFEKRITRLRAKQAGNKGPALG